MRFDLNLPAGAGLAPMAGVTDAATRLLSFEQGAAWAVCEMLSAKGFVYSNGRSGAIRELLFRFPGEGICGLQLFGREPEFVAEAARRLEGAGFSFIDLNFGCPAPKITGNGEGSALMKEPEQIAKVVRAAADAAVNIPVTVKIRSGWNPESVNAVEVAKICEQEGAGAIAVHARTRSQFYGGAADWSVIAAVRRAVKIPVFGNGDVRSGADAIRMLEQTGCDRVMVGRAAEGNPWIFREISQALKGEPYSPPAFPERMRTALRHLELAVGLYGEKKGVLEMRKHVAWYISGVPGAAKLREGVNGVSGAEEVRELLMRYAGL
ncbi:MAG: tRNA dihydrouridine synthase DusB [Clostridiales bacterium]|nr:tRNA dihydrouridine synthase DusB [Clostridiales bacterium]